MWRRGPGAALTSAGPGMLPQSLWDHTDFVPVHLEGLVILETSSLKDEETEGQGERRTPKSRGSSRRWVQSPNVLTLYSYTVESGS